VDQAPFAELFQKKDYAGMLRLVQNSMKLDMSLRIGCVNSGGPTHAPAWVETPIRMPIYGTAAFKATRVTAYFRKSFLEESPLPVVVAGMAHELSHVVLNSTGHAFRKEEAAVDLTAMILGYREFYLADTRTCTIIIHEPPAQGWMERLIHGKALPEEEIVFTDHEYGYLTKEELKYAASLME